MEQVQCAGPRGSTLVSVHVERDSVTNVFGRSNGVDAALGLAVAAVAAFDGIACGWQQMVVQKRQGLFQIGREQLGQGATDLMEAGDAATQPGQLGQGRVRAAAAIEQSIDLVHDAAQHPQVRQSAGDALQDLPFGGREMALHEQVPMLEQRGDALVDSLSAANQSPTGLGGTATREHGPLGFEFLADPRDRVQDRLRDFLEDMELAYLMTNTGKDLCDDRGIQRRAVRRDPAQGLAARLQLGLERLEEGADVVLGGTS